MLEKAGLENILASLNVLLQQNKSANRQMESGGGEKERGEREIVFYFNSVSSYFHSCKYIFVLFF